jgi:predicted glycosyltransferase involved in capsule biosynthesis
MGFFRTDIFAVNGFNQDFVGWGREDSELVVRFFNYGLKKKEHPFMAICFHLWHEENDRSYLEQNDAYLKKALESKNYVCKNGLVQQEKLHD